MIIFSVKLPHRLIKITLFSAAIFIIIVFFAVPKIQLYMIGDKENAAALSMPPAISAEAEHMQSDEKAPDVAAEPEKDYIKWVDFKVCYDAMEKALEIDIKSHETERAIDWVDLLAYLGAKYGGEFSRYKEKDLTDFAQKLSAGEKLDTLVADMKYFAYYREAYGAVLDEFVGEYSIEVETGEFEEPKFENRYGLKVFSPIARGYGFGDYDDFGASRSYGYKRRHLGHDMMGSVGTPIVAIESGIVEVMGWNQYGGWRIGIRSFDKKRYYYYAHLRKDHPFNNSVKEGDVVSAGDVIGYLGMTGYSTKENVNNIDTPHLHLGLQLIFDESQKDGVNQIWIDLYDIVKLLGKNKCSVYRDEETKDYFRKYDFYEKLLENNS